MRAPSPGLVSRAKLVYLSTVTKDTKAPKRNPQEIPILA